MSNSTPTMNPDAQREAALFQAAAQLTGNARASFLDSACQGSPALRQRLAALLAAHEQSQGALRETEPAVKATMKIEFPDAPDETVGQKIGRYKILEKVGEGGCGVVYVAEQTDPVRRRVALKVIKLGMDTKQVVARFEAERQALAMMDHPNIAKVLDAGATETPVASGILPDVEPGFQPGGSGDAILSARGNSPLSPGGKMPPSTAGRMPAATLPAGRPYFVMELVRGIRITDYCDQANLTTKDRLDLFIQVCHAIQHAHQKGIIHRDIKPSNILVTLHDGVPVPKVIDFGIAKATEGRLTDATVYTQLHQFIGTPAYMSPEQAGMSGLDIDTRSDIYSLGVLLYELLAGSTPFDAKDLMASGIDAMRQTIREKEPQRPSTRLATLGDDQLTTTAKRRSADTSKLLHQLNGDLDWIVMKCLEKDRQRRYETANGLAADLKRHLKNEPVAAGPPSATYKFQKAWRRNRAMFTAGAAVFFALVIGVAVSTWQAARAMRAERVQRRLLQQVEASRYQVSLVNIGAMDELRSKPELEAEWNELMIRVNHELGLCEEYSAELPLHGGSIRVATAGAESNQAYYQAMGDAAFRAVKTQEQKADRDPIKHAAALASAGDALRHKGALAEARATIQEAFILQQGLLGPDDQDLGQTLYQLAIVEKLLGETNAANAHFDQGMKILATHFADDQVARPYIALARAVWNLGPPGAVEHVLINLLGGIMKQQVGPDHPRFGRYFITRSRPLKSLATILNVPENALYQEAIEIETRISGPDHRAVKYLRMIVSESTPQGTRTKRAPTDSGSREFSDRLQAIVAAHAASAQTNPASEAFMDRLRVHSSRLMPSDATNAAKAISATNTRPEQVRPPVPAKVATPPTPRGP